MFWDLKLTAPCREIMATHILTVVIWIISLGFCLSILSITTALFKKLLKMLMLGVSKILLATVMYSASYSNLLCCKLPELPIVYKRHELYYVSMYNYAFLIKITIEQNEKYFLKKCRTLVAKTGKLIFLFGFSSFNV